MAGIGIREGAGLIRSLDAPVVVDHVARVDPGDEAAIRALEELLDTGGVWIKLSGADRVSAPPYDEGAALARRLLVDLPARIASSPEERERLLVTNPDALFF